MTYLPPGKPPEPAAVGAGSSAVVVHAASRRWIAAVLLIFTSVMAGLMLWFGGVLPMNRDPLTACSDSIIAALAIAGQRKDSVGGYAQAAHKKWQSRSDGEAGGPANGSRPIVQ